MDELFVAEIPYFCNDHLFATHADLIEMRRPDMCDASGFLMQKSPDVESARFPQGCLHKICTSSQFDEEI